MNQEVINTLRETLPIDLLPLETFSEIYGISLGALRARKHSGKYTEGKEIFTDQAGKIWVSISGHEQWVKNNSQRVSARTAMASKSALNLSMRKTIPMKRSTGTQPKLT